MMRTIIALVLAGGLSLAACSTATVSDPSASPIPSPPIEATPNPSVEPMPSPTDLATPSETGEPTPSLPTLTVDPATGESMLLSGVRQDLLDACTPIGTDLPRSAVAGLRCTPTGRIVEHMTLYLFSSQEDLLEAYRKWLTLHEIPPRSNGGRCIVGQASEGGFVPGDDHGIVVVERGGCYLDANGNAHYGVTLPPFVLAEVDGKVADIAAVEGWAWLGNQDQPGAPTVWRSNQP